MITIFQKSMLGAFYRHNRIPLWIFSYDQVLVASFGPNDSAQMESLLTEHMIKLLTLSPQKEFSILCDEKEFYCFFSFTSGQDSYYLATGPLLLTGLYHMMQMQVLSFAPILNSPDLKILVENLPIISLPDFASSLNMTMLFLTGNGISYDTISNFSYSNLSGVSGSIRFYEYFDELTNFTEHTPYSHEQAVLNCVRDGDPVRLESTYRTLPQTRYGAMSQNPLKQLFYGCIANTTLVTRYAIEGGFPEEEALCLSDSYIRQMEQAKTLYELELLNERMALDFTNRVAITKKQKHPAYSRPVNVCIRYINNHIREKITLDELASAARLTPKYLSTLFHSETGLTLQSWITEKRINEAKNLLLYSPYSDNQISIMLAFHSQSYFIQVFKKQTGLTPGNYRKSSFFISN